MCEIVHERTSHAVQKLVLVSENYSWSDDRSIGEYSLDGDLTLSLAPVELGGRVLGHIQIREVNKFRDPVLLCDASDRFGTGYMHGVEVEVPGEFRSDFVTQG